MMITLQDAIDHLYDLAVDKGRSQSPGRLRVLADYCVRELDRRGVRGARTEQDVPGGGRAKTWDIAWHCQGKHRLAISLKSIR